MNSGMELRELQDRLSKTEEDLVRYLRKSEAMPDEIVRALSVQPAVTRWGHAGRGLDG